MSIPSLLALSFRKLYSVYPEDALQLVEMGLDLPWSMICSKEFFELGLQRGLSERDRFLEILSLRVFSDLACPLVYDQDTLQLERFRAEQELEELPSNLTHNITFYRSNFVLGWRSFPYKSIAHYFLSSHNLDDLLHDSLLLDFYRQDSNYASFLSLYRPLHYLLQTCDLEELKSVNLNSTDLCRALELKIIYNQEAKEAFALLSTLSDKRGHLPDKVNQALLVTGQGVLERSKVSHVSALAFGCQYRHLTRVLRDLPRVDLFLNAFEGWLHHRRLEDFYFTTQALLQTRIGKQERIKICQFSRALPVDIVAYLLTLMEEKVYFLKGILANNKGYLATTRFCEIKLQELAAQGQGLILPPLV
ncbi:Hypothetical protein BRZCDTV_381 [Brazilian cedratvirus IHUMI]|uniref:Uncharacterized protein n=1 Tax=Brazilian cedratvirus IHUMI TaxID=2126980 RepID=A0A2R8FEW7_9VIRU|nr:Hypothetical protein BRZCDTV_381 [Brazilian cedratvirus IHUMI]